jgi:hypothetical protein
MPVDVKFSLKESKPSDTLRRLLGVSVSLGIKRGLEVL